MNRRGFILSAAVCAASCGTPVFAVTAADEIAADLVRSGYTITSSQRTFLGRVRINAVKGRRHREVVLDPASGEVLRDYSDISSGGKSDSSSGTSAGQSGGTSTGGDGDGTGGDAVGGGDGPADSDRPTDSDRPAESDRPSGNDSPSGDGNVD